MNVGFMEPCCISKQLPPLVRQYEFLPFQTSGDVTFEQLIKAVSSLAGNRLAVKVITPQIDTQMLRVLAWYGRRGWLKSLSVLTQENQVELIHKEITDAVDDLHCYHHNRVVEGMLIIEGEVAKIIVQGFLTSEVNGGHRFYYIHRTTFDKPLTEMFIKTVLPLMRKEDAIATESETKGEEEVKERDATTVEEPVAEDTATEETTSEDTSEESVEEDVEEKPTKVKKVSSKKTT